MTEQVFDEMLRQEEGGGGTRNRVPAGPDLDEPDLFEPTDENPQPEDPLLHIFLTDIEDTQAQQTPAAQFAEVDAMAQTLTDHELYLDQIQSIANQNKAKLSALEQEVNRVDERIRGFGDRIKDVEEMSTQKPEINLATADFIYRSVVATGGVVALTGALFVLLAYQLYLVSGVLLLAAAFFWSTYQRGLKPINV